MAQVPYRINLSASKIPFISQFQGRTVIVPGQDQNYITALTAPQAGDPAEDKDRGVPQIFYAHNVMPSAQGFESIGYKGQAAAVIGAATFQERYTVQDSAGHFVYLAVDRATRQTYYLDSNLVWTATASKPGAGFTASKIVTTAYVNGVSYINFGGDDCYTFDFGTLDIVSAALTGITIADAIGITGASGYLLAWNETTLYWSSTTDPTDFTPSLATGAGSGGVQNIKGAITIAAPISTGLIVYSNQNAVAAVYSGNARFPFNFREIPSCGGCPALNLLAFDANTGNHYSYTSSGLQLISSISSQTVFPDATDFIAGKFFEDFDELALTFNVTPLVNVMLKKLTVIADRYLVISYGINALTHAIVCDLVNKRWGKFKVPHTEVFEWSVLTAVSSEIPRESIGFLQLNGTILTVDFSIAASNSSGVILLGKYQYIRQRWIQLEQADVEEIQPNAALAIYDLTTYDGKTFNTPVAGYQKAALNAASTVRQYNFTGVGLNHSLLLIGSFYLSSIILMFNIHGRN
jgi:hypothetical protein